MVQESREALSCGKPASLSDCNLWPVGEGALVGAAGGLELGARVLAHDAARNGERDGDERPDQQDDNDGAERQGCRGLHQALRSGSALRAVHRSGLILKICFSCFRLQDQ